VTPRSDEELIDLLHNALAELDQVPRPVVEAARGAFAWRNVDAELAELLYDSSVSPELAGVRSDVAARQLSFALGDVEIELLVRDAEAEPRIDVQIIPAGVQTLEVRDGETSAPTTTDAHGRCTLPLPRARRIQLLLTRADGSMVATPWITL
jgi:hypothetical protein